MFRYLLRLFFLLLCVAICRPSIAAQGDGNLPPLLPQVQQPSGDCFMGRVVDSLTRTPLPSAVITLIVPNIFKPDEIVVKNYVTDDKGRFKIYLNTLQIKGRFEISFLGYQVRTIYPGTYHDRTDQIYNLGDIKLVESPQGIDDVVVNARMQLYKIHGDTTIFFPRAVKTMEGDNALEILRRMPGVEVSKTGAVKVMGQPVERTYVNDKLVFGEDPTLALRKLEADEVRSILAYDEVDEEDAVRNGENARKRKVLNVVTFKDFTRSLQGKALAAAGAEFDADQEGRHTVRYDALVDGGYYSESLQSELRGNIGNLGAWSSNPERARHGDVDASVSGKAGTEKRHSYNASYFYSHDRTERSSISRSIYFPTDYFAAKQSDDTTRMRNTAACHRFGGGYGYRDEKLSVSTSLSGSWGDSRRVERMLSRVDQDGALLLATDRTTRKRSDNYKVDGSFSLSRRFSGDNSLDFRFSFDRSDDEGVELRDDRQSSPEEQTYAQLRRDLGAPRRRINGSLSYSRTMFVKSTLTLQTSLSSDRTGQRSLAFDAQTDAPELSISDDVTDRLLQWKTGVRWRTNMLPHHITFDAQYVHAPRRYENAVFATDERKTFHLYELNGGYSYLGQKGTFMFSLMARPNLPYGHMLSRRINDDNPLFLSAGNPGLKASNYYAVQINSDVRGEKGSLNIWANLSVQTDPIAMRRLYFDTDATLEQYDDYAVRAGATLLTYENAASEELSATLRLNYRIRVSPLRCFLDAMASYDYMRRPEDAGEGFRNTHRHNGTLHVELASDFSRMVRLKLVSETLLSYHRMPQNPDVRNVREQLHAELRWDLLRRCVFTSSYQLEVNRSTYAAGDFDTHRLNLSLGCRMLDRKAVLSFNAYDVLSRVDNFRTSQNVQGITYYWRRNFGRYFTCSFEYRFNNRK